MKWLELLKSAMPGEGAEGTSIQYLYGYVPPNLPGTGYNILNTRKFQLCKQLSEIIQGAIAFKNVAQYVNEQTVSLCVALVSLRPWF